VSHLLKLLLLKSFLFLANFVKSYTRILRASSFIDYIPANLFVFWEINFPSFEYFFLLIRPSSRIKWVYRVELRLMIIVFFAGDILSRVVSNLKTAYQTLHQITFWHVHYYLFTQHEFQRLLETKFFGKCPWNLFCWLTFSHN